MKFLGTQFDIPASTSTSSTFKIESGTAPSSPNNGDTWQDGSHLYIRLGGITYQLDRQNGNSWIETEVDFGIIPTYNKEFTITDANSLSTSYITVLPSGKTATGRIGNDWSWDTVQFSALPSNGSFVISAVILGGSIVDKRKIQYKIN